VLVQAKLLDSYRLGSLAIGCFDRSEVLVSAAHYDDPPASEIGKLFEIGTPGHAAKIGGRNGGLPARQSRHRARDQNW
jgi:hypothetical protein